MKVYWGVEVQHHELLISALGGGEWSASRLGRFTPREIAPGTHWIGGWVGPRAGLDTVVKRGIKTGTFIKRITCSNHLTGSWVITNSRPVCF
jgi:hypothetical protein